MGQQRVKEDAKAEKTEKKSAPKEEKKIIVKKWKGKEWFSIMSPVSFGNTFIADTPTTDPKTLVGRTVFVNVADFFRQPQKYYMKMQFKINKVDGKNAYTRFNGYVCLKEYLSRYVRKGSQKIMSIEYYTTKDNWNIQVYSMAVLNRNTDAAVQTAVRKAMREYLAEKIQTSTIEEFMKAVIAGIHQKHMKKTFSKIYPIRFSEISKIEVIKAPEEKTEIKKEAKIAEEKK